MFKIFDEVQSFYFCCLCFWYHIWEITEVFCGKDLFLCFLLKVLSHTFRSVVQFGLIFVCDVRKGSAAAKSPQSCPTLCDLVDSSPPGSAIPGILQARTLEWVAISFSNAWKWKVKVKLLSRVRLFATPWTAAHQAPPSMGFSKQLDSNKRK